jgi:hypothetical protein
MAACWVARGDAFPATADLPSASQVASRDPRERHLCNIKPTTEFCIHRGKPLGICVIASPSGFMTVIISSSALCDMTFDALGLKGLEKTS